MYTYKVIRTPTDFLEVELNQRAAEGWRVVSVQCDKEGGIIPNATVVLECPKVEKES